MTIRDHIKWMYLYFLKYKTKIYKDGTAIYLNEFGNYIPRGEINPIYSLLRKFNCSELE